MSDPDPEHPSSAINGHLNPGGGQHLAPGTLLFGEKRKLLLHCINEKLISSEILCSLSPLFFCMIENASIKCEHIFTDLGVDGSVAGDRV